MSQRKRSGERRQSAPDEPARPARDAAEAAEQSARAGSDGRPQGAGHSRGTGRPRDTGQSRTESNTAQVASDDGEAAVEEEEASEAEATAEAVEEAAPEGESREGESGAGDQAAAAQRDEYLELAQRTKADFENYRKRATRELAAAGVRGKAELARELLPVVDNLERALESADDGEARLAEGVRLVLSELIAALERNGVSPIQPVGEPFDPNLHEALSTRAENGADPGVVLDVVQKGYRLDQTVLRPARVVVSA